MSVNAHWHFYLTHLVTSLQEGEENDQSLPGPALIVWMIWMAEELQMMRTELDIA